MNPGGGVQAELTDTENRLSYARLSYNDVVMNYNNIIAVFPNNLLAGGRSPRPRAYDRDLRVHHAVPFFDPILDSVPDASRAIFERCAHTTVAPTRPESSSWPSQRI